MAQFFERGKQKNYSFFFSFSFAYLLFFASREATRGVLSLRSSSPSLARVASERETERKREGDERASAFFLLSLAIDHRLPSFFFKKARRSFVLDSLQ